jgi:hypothetical protein
MIKSYRWKVETPRDRAPQGLELPVLKMEILDFDDYSGSPDEPNYFEDVVDVGWGRDDGSAQQVLRKWYYGECVVHFLSLRRDNVLRSGPIPICRRWRNPSRGVSPVSRKPDHRGSLWDQ